MMQVPPINVVSTYVVDKKNWMENWEGFHNFFDAKISYMFQY